MADQSSIDHHLSANECSSAADPLGFDLPENDWMDRLRRAEAAPEMLGRLGSYELLGRAGHGGQGVIYRGRQPNTGREVALKLLSGGSFASPETKARFEREIEAAAALDHPNVVTVFGSETIDGELVLAMQWIDGLPFDRWADGQSPSAAGRGATEPTVLSTHERRSVSEVLTAFAAVCDAVHHAHQRGIIHRDLKPSNILVDAHGRPHVLDFGLAKLEREGVASSEMTLTGAFLGTPAYAAPEQVRGEIREVDVRSDVYSLGAVLYQALTTRTPYDATAGLGRLLEEFEHTPRPLSSIDQRLNRELDAITLKALNIDKGQRYGSVEALRADVLRYLAGEPVLAHPPSAGYRARKFLRRHAAVSALASLAAAALVTLGIVSTVQAGRERALRSKSEKHERIAMQEATLQKETADFLMRIMGQIVDTAAGRRSIPVKSLADWIAKPLEDESVQSRPDVRIQLHRSVGALRHAARHYKQGLVHKLKALELARAVQDEEVCFLILQSLSNSFRSLSRYAEAEQYANEALDLARSAFGRDSTQASLALVRVAHAVSKQDRRVEAENALREAMGICDRLGAPASDADGPRFLLADLYLEWGRPAESHQVMEEYLASRNRKGVQSNSDAQCHLRLAKAAFYLGNLDRADQVFATVVQYRVKEQGLKYYRTSEALRLHGLTLHYLRRYAEAADCFENSLVFKEIEAEDIKVVAQTRLRLGATMLAAGREDEGRRQLLRAVSKGKIAEPGHPEWDALAQRVESALRSCDFRLGAALHPQMGDLAWLVNPFYEPGTMNEGGNEVPKS